MYCCNSGRICICVHVSNKNPKNWADERVQYIIWSTLYIVYTFHASRRAFGSGTTHGARLRLSHFVYISYRRQRAWEISHGSRLDLKYSRFLFLTLCVLLVQYADVTRAKRLLFPIK